MAIFMNSFKYIIFLVNLIFFGLGIYLAYEAFKQLGNDIFNLDATMKSPIYMTFVIAIIVVFISFLGCCGTCQESSCMIRTYAGLILICVILQIAAIVMIMRTDPNEVAKSIKNNILGRFGEQTPSVQKSIQLFQQEHRCCGIEGWQDYFFNEKEDLSKVPNSCCESYKESNSDKENVGKCQKEKVNKNGCKDTFSNFIQSNYKNVYIVVGCIFGFQLLVVILSCALSKNIKEQYNVV